MPTRRGVIGIITAFLLIGGLTAMAYQKLGTIPGVAAVFCSIATPALSEVGGCLVIGEGSNTNAGDTSLPSSPAPATIIREEIVIREETAPGSSSSGLISMLRKVDEALNAVIFNQQTITYIQEDIADLEDEVAKLRRKSSGQDNQDREELNDAIGDVTVDTVIQGTFTLEDITGVLGGSLLFVNWLGEVATGTLSGAHVTADSLDFTEFSDTLTADATTTFDLDSNAADLDFDNSTLFIDSSLNRIGIGTSTPLYTLDVVGSAHLTDSLAVDAAMTILGLSTLATTTITDATIASALITTGSVTDFSATNATSTNLISTNATSTNSFITNLLASYGTFGELTVTGSTTLATTSISYLTVGDSVASGLITASRFAATDANATSTFGNLTASGDVTIAGNLTVSGDSYVVGTSSASTIVVNSSINSDLIPTINAVYDIGSPAFFWNDGYFDSITVNSISAASTSISGTQSNNFTINSDNASSDTESMSLIFYRGVVVPNALITWDATQDRFDFNQPTFIQNDSSTTTVPTLDVRGKAGQSADIFRVASSSGTSYFGVSATGTVSISELSNGVLVADNTGTILASSTLSAAFIQDAFVQNTGDTMTGTLILPNSGLQIGASVPFSDTGGTLTLQNIDALDATTEATIETSIDTLANLASAVSLATVGTITTGTWNATAIDISDYSNLAVSAPGLELSGDSIALSAGYVIPTTASTTAWDSNVSSQWTTSGSDLYYTTGNVSVGTTTVAARFSIQSSGTDDILTLFETDGTEVFTVLENGNVGIGTTSPSAKLTIDARTNGSGYGLYIDTNTRTAGEPYVYFGDADTPDFLVDSSGNIGIGTTSPTAKLNVWGVSGSSDNLFSIASSTGNQYLTVTSAGNLGIGNSNPSYPLQVQNSEEGIISTLLTNNGVRNQGLYFSTDLDSPYVASIGSSGTSAGEIQIGSGVTGASGIRINTSGDIGIGVTDPDKRLEVFETVSDDQFRISYDATRYADFQVDSAGDLIIDAQGGDVRLNDENQWVCSGGSCPASSPTGTGNIVVERDVIIHGKLDVATIDPIYRIGGVNYATFGVSAIGVKEEASETIKLTERNEKTGYYEYRINWSDLPKASNLWLFYQVTDFGVLWDKLAVTLTAGFDGRVFYTKDFKNNALIIQATAPGEVSARFMANRFDWKQWSNVRPDQDTKPHFDLEDEK